MKKHVIIVGTGPGGSAAAMLLANRGFKVSVFEKSSKVGGRNSSLDMEGYKSDVGPTFLMMKFLLDSVFEEAGVRSEDYLRFIKLDPLYELKTPRGSLIPYNDHQKTKEGIEKLFPGQSKGFDAFMNYEKKRFSKIIPCLQRDYSSLKSMVSLKLMMSAPYLSITRSVFDVLKGYFGNDDLSLLFSFQSKYLGMSAWKCPGGFSMLSYIEHAYGIYHTIGGLSEIPKAMIKVATEQGAEIHLNSPVKKLVFDGKKVVGVELEGGEQVRADAVFLNADFAHAMEALVPSGKLKKYSSSNLSKKKYSCSTFMIHLGLDRVYPSQFHTIVFADNYKKNVDDIFHDGELSWDTSFYVRNASVLDDTLAPKGHSSLYILVPVPNLDARIDWENVSPKYRNHILDLVEKKMGFTDLKKHIRAERVMTPATWKEGLSVYKGATFNLSHHLSQMAYFRPRNRFEELRNCYLVGGGTHPGSGLPTILESARISANLACEDFGVPFRTKELVL